VPGISSKAVGKLDRNIQKVRDKGAARIEALERQAADRTAGKETEPDEPESEMTLIAIDGKPWNRETNPVKVDWWSDALNARANRTLAHMQKNLESVKDDPARLLAGWFAVLPQTLFVVMPLFAVLLKIFYLFKRRLYMEHLLVALHSHAFIFMSVLIILLLSVLGGFAEGIEWLQVALAWLTGAAWIWLFVYLFIMQKRVYRQGWIMTSLKYCVIGLCYSIFLSIALVFAGFVSLALT
jgi:hypothetical protein